MKITKLADLRKIPVGTKVKQIAPIEAEFIIAEVTEDFIRFESKWGNWFKAFFKGRYNAYAEGLENGFCLILEDGMVTCAREIRVFKFI